MALDNGWQPLSKPTPREGAGAFVVTPFTRLARTHAAAVAGDAFIAIALANSLFFDIDPNAARTKVALYLALTMAPFAVVAPLIGPALDRMRGGRRLMLIGSNALRAVLCVLMVGDLDNMLLFPEAFAVLVLAKSYHVAKSAIVPTVVRSDDELVEANSRLAFLSGIIAIAAGAPALAVSALLGSQGVLVMAVGVFAVGAFLGIKVPATQVAADRTSQTEREELRGVGIVLAASAMGMLRGIVGFLTFLVAFSLRSSDAPLWQFGFVVLASSLGSLLGSLVAPALRRNGTPEERILQIGVAATAAAGVLAAWAGGIGAAAALALFVGLAASSGKLAFDSVVQRDAPDANRGRSFARFETRFQLMWVVGAFIPVAVTIPMEIGFVVIAAAAAFAVVSYLAALRGLARGEVPVRRRPTEVITSRLRRRRQGFAVDTGDTPPPEDAAHPVDDEAPYEPDAPTSLDPSAIETAPPEQAGPTLFDEPVDDTATPATSPAPVEDETDPPHGPSRDRRVVIDPTNL
jgi:Major Facilitator Superfamily